jgi:hypothetical protein
MATPDGPSPLATASKWTRWTQVMSTHVDLSRDEVNALSKAERLRLIEVVLGVEAIVDEINLQLRLLRINYEYRQDGWDCGNQRDSRGVTMGYCINEADQFIFHSVDPCRLLPLLASLRKRVGTSPPAASNQIWRRVGRLVDRCTPNRPLKP